MKNHLLMRATAVGLSATMALTSGITSATAQSTATAAVQQGGGLADSALIHHIAQHANAEVFTLKSAHTTLAQKSTAARELAADLAAVPAMPAVLRQALA